MSLRTFMAGVQIAAGIATLGYLIRADLRELKRLARDARSGLTERNHA